MEKNAKVLTIVFLLLSIMGFFLTYFEAWFRVGGFLFFLLALVFWAISSLRSIKGNKMAVRSILGGALTEHPGPSLLFVPMWFPGTYLQEYPTEVKIFDFPEHIVDTKSEQDPATGDVTIGREKVKINTNLVIRIPRAGTGGLIKFHRADLSAEDDELQEWAKGVLQTFYVAVGSSMTYIMMSQMSTSLLQEEVAKEIKKSVDDPDGLLGAPGFKEADFLARIQEVTLPKLVQEEMEAINKATLEKARLERDRVNVLYKQETEKEQKEIEAEQKAQVKKIEIEMDKVLALIQKEIVITGAEADGKKRELTLNKVVNDYVDQAKGQNVSQDVIDKIYFAFTNLPAIEAGVLTQRVLELKNSNPDSDPEGGGGLTLGKILQGIMLLQEGKAEGLKNSPSLISKPTNATNATRQKKMSNRLMTIDELEKKTIAKNI
ncbi:MAG: hypothetical protein Q8N55_04615 [bacterium]|nr:hypothetical protein [bacterium]